MREFKVKKAKRLQFFFVGKILKSRTFKGNLKNDKGDF